MIEALQLNISSDIIKALVQLVKLCKQQSCSPDKVVHEDFFKNLCDLINSQSDNMTLPDTVQIIKLLHKLRLHNSSKTLSYLLQHLDTLVNQASLADYNKILSVIMQMPSVPLAQAIKTRLIQKFLFKISTGFDGNNFEFLTEAFRFACFNIQDKKILNIITHAIKNSNFDIQSPYNILSLLKTLNVSNHYSMEFEEILIKAQNALIVNIDQCNSKDISIMLSMSARKEKFSRLKQFYNKTLYDKIIQKLISAECNLSEGIDCLNAIISVKHTSKELLDYLSGKIYVEKEIDRNTIKSYVSFSMLEGFANLKYKPIWWETFEDLFRNIDFNKYNMETLLYRAYHMACLDYYQPELLEILFKRSFNFRGRYTTHHTFLRLYQKLKTVPGYTGPLPSQLQIQSFETLTRTVTAYPIYTNLKEALGGAEYVKTNVRTKLYHQIDHVIAIQPGGDPFAINSIKKQESAENYNSLSMEYLEDLNIPENCQVIAVICVPTKWYARNTDQILGTFATYIETLETLSCQVITISDSIWQSLPKDSRTAFLMDAIKSKLNDNKQNVELVY
ncbi:uncharacterized protein LOC131663857 isoform X2 [Phymastichus coffea]|uniref:uncharacterized protein LOC131663857 isoform X2 n=1 Tax=Phymastichus coffea TaxID=108790 RepID=UPI00273A7D38|nr:uncharacterized protein LOC131663857 isoform X2 [Phymastichus coffea]